MRVATQAAWFSLGCALASGVLVMLATIAGTLEPTALEASTAASPMLQVHEPVLEHGPEVMWPTPQRPSSMPPPDEPEELLRPTADPIRVREVFWDPDSVAMPSPRRTRPEAPRWNPDAVAPPSYRVRVRSHASGVRHPVALWDPNSATPPSLNRTSSDSR
jgi:hypothetical protein